MLPLIFGAVYAGCYFKKISFSPLIYFLIAVLAFDMFTTALNNYQDWKRAVRKEGYNYEEHNAIVRYGMAEKKVVAIIITLFGVAAVFGLITFFNSGIIVLVLGFFSFLTGILYSTGPLPISRTPLGEMFSGFFMGFVLPFLTIYITVGSMQPISFTLAGNNLSLELNLGFLLPAALILVPPMFLIANIMLANNICDIEDDRVNNRYTLPVLIGAKKSLLLFNLLNVSCYLDVILCIILGYLPLFSLAVLIPMYKVFRNLKAFGAVQTKKDTFTLSVQNFILIILPLIISVPGLLL